MSTTIPVLAALAALAAWPALAPAEDFPASGGLSVNGHLAVLPDGVFGGSAYDPVTGAIAPGAFAFPEGTLSFDSSFGAVTATYQLAQSGTAGGRVAMDGSATLGPATLSLAIVQVAVGGTPLPVGDCTFGPIEVILAGNASADGLMLTDSGFAIPPVGASDCGGFGSAINQELAGDDNGIELRLAGDFPLPTDDAIFVDGFDPAGA